MLPPESRTVMTTFHLFLPASASAPASAFLACSSVIGGPYGGACALAEAAVKTSIAPTIRDRSFSILMGVILVLWDQLDTDLRRPRRWSLLPLRRRTRCGRVGPAR